MFLLQLRNELWKLFGKKRTYLGAFMFMLIQSLIILLFHFLKHGGPVSEMERNLKAANLDPAQYITALSMSALTLMATAFILLPLFVALIGGDLVAKEAEDGSLRMILSRPVSRLRLLVLKWSAGWCFSFMLVALIGTYGYAFGRIFFPAGGMYVLLPMEQQTIGAFEPDAAWQAYILAHVALALKGGAIMSLAFMFSCFNVKPAAATIMAISMIFMSFIIQGIPYFQDFKPWFFTYHLDLWSHLFQDPVPWWQVKASLCMLAGYTMTFFIIGVTAFQIRDIKS